MISAKCKNCKKKYKLKDSAAGKTINCECGNAVEVPKETDEERNLNSAAAEFKSSEEANAKSTPNRRTELPDLTNKKVCSKCKNLFDMSVKVCPKCGFNTTGTNYDKSHREEVTRNYSQKVYQVGKYVVPGIILLFFLWHFKMQMSCLTALKNLDNNVIMLLKNEATDKLNKKKLDPSVDTMLRYYLDKDKIAYFIAVPKKNEDKKFALFGNGFFTLKNAGVCYIVKYNADSRPLPRYYIEGEDGAPKLINPRDYELIKYASIAFKFVYTE